MTWVNIIEGQSGVMAEKEEPQRSRVTSKEESP